MLVNTFASVHYGLITIQTNFNKRKTKQCTKETVTK